MTNMSRTFVTYLMDFYGKGGLYDYGFTPDEILAGTLHLVSIIGVDEFEGDSVDRERVRDIVLETRKANVEVRKVRVAE